eukprot:scaffold44335_cov51-Phaeocystis_antarctica.AAC.2
MQMFTTFPHPPQSGSRVPLHHYPRSRQRRCPPASAARARPAAPPPAHAPARRRRSPSPSRSGRAPPAWAARPAAVA